MRKLGIGMMIGVLLVTAGLACGEYLSNGGFETGDLTDWLTINPGAETGAHTTKKTASDRTVLPYEGNYFAIYMAADNLYGALYQAVAVPADTWVKVTFVWQSIWSGAQSPGYVAVNNTSSPPAPSYDFFTGAQASCEYVDSYQGEMDDWAPVSVTFKSDGYVTVSAFAAYTSGTSPLVLLDAASVEDAPAVGTVVLIH